MSVWSKILATTAGVAALVGLSSPAAAQISVRIGSGYSYGGYAPNYGYGGYAPSYGYGGYAPSYGYGYNGYNSNYGYGLDPRAAVDVCSRTVERNYGARVTGISSADPRNDGAFRVHGYVTSYGGYSYGNSSMGFSCKVDRYSRVVDLQLERNGYDGGW
jgi:hypothetical protein